MNITSPFFEKIFKMNESELIAFMNRHRIYSIVQLLIEVNAEKFLNIDNFDKIKNVTFQKRMANLKATSQLIKLSEFFDDHNVEYLALKGPVLSYELFDDVSVRDYHDLDIFVSPDEFMFIHSLLLNNGYKNLDDVEELTDKQFKEFFKGIHHFSYLSDSNVIVELHNRIFGLDYSSKGLHFEFNSMCDNKRKIEYNGYQISVPGIVDNFIFLVFHGSKHAWIRLKWLYDINAFISVFDMNWKEIAAKFEEINICHMFVQTLLLLEKYFDFDIPAELNSLINSNKLGRKLYHISAILIENLDDEQFKLGHKNFFLYKKYRNLVLKGFNYKINQFLYMFKPKVIDFKSLKLNDRYYFLYYFYRPIHRILRLLRREG